MDFTEQAEESSRSFPDLPRAITSFGAAVLDDVAYVYGGHFGKAHHYYSTGQSGNLLQLNLTKVSDWEVVATGPRLQGLAMVAHGRYLYRMGGFEARNNEDEEQDLWSVADFVRFDPAAGQWLELPPMPTARSSFDAVVADGTLYVIGGWNLQGSKDAEWQDGGYSIDLAVEPLVWKQLPSVPFQRRALSLGTALGQIIVIGGMQPDGEVTRRTSIYVPAQQTWSDGPELPGEKPMEGFGTACCTLRNRLYVSTSSGNLLRMGEDAKSWKHVHHIDDARFFHQMLPTRPGCLLLIGGASMEKGKYATVNEICWP